MRMIQGRIGTDGVAHSRHTALRPTFCARWVALALRTVLTALTALITVVESPEARSQDSASSLPVSMPAGTTYEVVDAFPGLRFPPGRDDILGLTSPPRRTNELFATGQNGTVLVITNLAVPTRSVFLDLTDRTFRGAPSIEPGLVGLAFHPQYDLNRQFFVFYTRTNSATRKMYDTLSRFETDPANPARALASSEKILFSQVDVWPERQGGDLQFGPDGYLYVSLGDGGGHGGILNSQRIDKDFFSGILRIDVDGRTGSLAPHPHAALGTGYRIPPDNPFVGARSFMGKSVVPGAIRTEFWAVGLRNPFRMAFDSLTGELYTADVGEVRVEEINRIVRGGNYGWNFLEGQSPHSGARPLAGTLRPPLFQYGHAATDQGVHGKAVIGGMVYRGPRYPGLQGKYLFADYASRQVVALNLNGTGKATASVLATTPRGITGFAIHPLTGEILMVERDGGRIVKIVDRSEDLPKAAPEPSPAPAPALAQSPVTAPVIPVNRPEPAPAQTTVVPPAPVAVDSPVTVAVASIPPPVLASVPASVPASVVVSAPISRQKSTPIHAPASDRVVDSAPAARVVGVAVPPPTAAIEFAALPLSTTGIAPEASVKDPTPEKPVPTYAAAPSPPSGRIGRATAAVEAARPSTNASAAPLPPLTPTRSTWELGSNQDPSTSVVVPYHEFGVQNNREDAPPGAVSRLSQDPLFQGSSNPGPDDDYYFAGIYPAGFNGLETLLAVPNDEPLSAWERSLTAGDPANRIHFLLSPEQVIPGASMRLSFEFGTAGSMVGGVFRSGFSLHEIAVRFRNRMGVTTPLYVRRLARPTTAILEFTAEQVSALEGPNSIEFVRTGPKESSASHWLDYDFVKLEAVPPVRSVWQLGTDEDQARTTVIPFQEFGSENERVDAAPGRVSRLPGDPAYVEESNPGPDDDYYFAGSYPAGFNGLESPLEIPGDEPASSWERFLTAADPYNRIHVVLTPAQVASGAWLRLSFEFAKGGSAYGGVARPGFADHEVVVRFRNGAGVSTPLYSRKISRPSVGVLDFKASQVKATAGPNTIEFVRTGPRVRGASYWLAYDYVKLEVVPASTVAAAATKARNERAAAAQRTQRLRSALPEAFAPGRSVAHGAETVNGVEYLTLTYVIPEPPVPGVGHRVEVSEDLVRWKPAPVVTMADRVEAGHRVITVRDTVPLKAGVTRFFRVRVSADDEAAPAP